MALGTCIISDLLSKSGKSHSAVEPGLRVLNVGASPICCLLLLSSTVDSDLLRGCFLQLPRPLGLPLCCSQCEGQGPPGLSSMPCCSFEPIPNSSLLLSHRRFELMDSFVDPSLLHKAKGWENWSVCSAQTNISWRSFRFSLQLRCFKFLERGGTKKREKGRKGDSERMRDWAFFRYALGVGTVPIWSRRALLPGCPSEYLLSEKHKYLPRNITVTLVFSSLGYTWNSK